MGTGSRIVERPGDPRHAVPRQPLREHPPDDRCRFGVGFQPVRPAAPRGVGFVRVRPGVGEPVPVRRPAAEVAALLAGLGGHRGADPDPGPRDLSFGLVPEGQHRLLVILGLVVDPAAEFGGPQLDAVVLEQRRHGGVLAAVEGALVFADHDGVPAALWIGQLSNQRSGLRAARPGQRPAEPDVEELGHDPPVPSHQSGGLLPLPGPRGHRILMILSRHPPVKGEPQQALGRSVCPAAAGALRPDCQHIAAPGPASRMSQIRSGHASTSVGTAGPATQDPATTGTSAECER